MKPIGYRAVRSLRVNHTNGKQIGRIGGKLLLCGNAICDISTAGRLTLQDDLIVGANLRKGSSAETYLKIQDGGCLTVTGQFQVFFQASLEIFQNGVLTLGKGYMNTGASIACAKSITLGEGVFIARNVYITDSDHHCFFDTEGFEQNGPAPVCIGNHVLICFGAVVLKGVTIGDGAVVAAGAVVTRDIPPGCLAAGVPAKVIKEGVIWK